MGLVAVVVVEGRGRCRWWDRARSPEDQKGFGNGKVETGVEERFRDRWVGGGEDERGSSRCRIWIWIWIGFRTWREEGRLSVKLRKEGDAQTHSWSRFRKAISRLPSAYPPYYAHTLTHRLTHCICLDQTSFPLIGQTASQSLHQPISGNQVQPCETEKQPLRQETSHSTTEREQAEKYRSSTPAQHNTTYPMVLDINENSKRAPHDA